MQNRKYNIGSCQSQQHNNKHQFLADSPCSVCLKNDVKRENHSKTISQN